MSFFYLEKTKEKRFQRELESEVPYIVIIRPTYGTMIKKLKKYQQKRHSTIYILYDLRMNKEVADENGKKMSFWRFIMRKVLEHEIYYRDRIVAYLKVF